MPSLFVDKKLHLFFKKDKTGPYALLDKETTVSDKQYAQSVKEAFDDWLAAKAAVGGAPTPMAAGARAAATAAQQQQTEQRRKRMADRQGMAQQAMKKMRESGDSSFKPEPEEAALDPAAARLPNEEPAAGALDPRVEGAAADDPEDSQRL